MDANARDDLVSAVIGVCLGLVIIWVLAYGCGTVLDVPGTTPTTSTTFPEPVEPPLPPE